MLRCPNGAPHRVAATRLTLPVGEAALISARQLREDVAVNEVSYVSVHHAPLICSCYRCHGKRYSQVVMKRSHVPAVGSRRPPGRRRACGRRAAGVQREEAVGCGWRRLLMGASRRLARDVLRRVGVQPGHQRMGHEQSDGHATCAAADRAHASAVERCGGLAEERLA